MTAVSLEKFCLICGLGSHRKTWKLVSGDFVACEGHGLVAFQKAVGGVVPVVATGTLQNKLPPAPRLSGAPVVSPKVSTVIPAPSKNPVLPVVDPAKAVEVKK